MKAAHMKGIKNSMMNYVLIGFDDSPIADEQLWPALSTVRQPVEGNG